MTEPSDDAVLQRLGRLERTARRWKLVGVGVLVALSLVVLVGASARKDLTVADEVVTRQFILVGRTPTPRASITIGKEGGPSLLLLDQQGQVRAGLTVLDDGRPSLGLLDAQGQSRLVLALDPNGTPMVRLLDERGQVVWSTP